MKQKKQNALSVLLGYAGSHRRLTLLGLGLSAVSMVCSMVPYICIWLAARALIAAAPDWARSQHPQAGHGPCDAGTVGLF